MTSIFLPRVLTTLLIAAAGALGTGAWAATSAHDHGHATAAKPLPPGKRWPTDAPLRQGMSNIRSALEARLEAVHQDQLGADQYKALATRTEEQVAHIVSNCKLAPDADAALHGILAQIGESTEAMSGRSATRPRDGAVKLIAALDEYGRTFDHPGWKNLHP